MKNFLPTPLDVSSWFNSHPHRTSCCVLG